MLLFSEVSHLACSGSDGEALCAGACTLWRPCLVAKMRFFVSHLQPPSTARHGPWKYPAWSGTRIMVVRLHVVRLKATDS